MRKLICFFCLLLSFVILLLLAACGEKTPSAPTTQDLKPSGSVSDESAGLTLDALVEYDINAGTVSGAGGETALVPGTEITLTAEAKDGFFFIGWSEGAYLEQYGELVSEEAAYTVTVAEGMKFYANFLKETEALLCYYANGGSISSSGAQQERLIQKVELGEHPYPMTLSQNGTFSREGYNILEYTTEADGSGVVTNIGQRVFAPTDKLISLYVQWVEESPAEAFVFEETDGGCYITSYSGDDAVLSIPAEYNGAAVVGVRSNAVSSPSVETVVFPATVTSVEDDAFAGCTALTKVYLFDSLWEMTDESFAGCPIQTVCLNSVFEEKYYGEGTGKLEVLADNQNSGENRLVVVSGSSGLFALDCELLQNSLTRDYSVVNFALQIAVPNTFAMSVMSPYLHEGDAVVLAPEAELKQYNNKLTTMVFTKFDGAFTAFRDVDISLYRDFFDSLAMFSLAKQSDTDSLMDAGEQFYTNNGDTANYHEAEDFESNYSFSSPLYHYDMSERIYTDYNLAVDALNAKGVKCYLTFGPFCTEACEGEVTAEMLDEYSTTFGEKLNAIRISDQSSYDFPKGYFFEMYHMTQEGCELRTNQLIEDLNAQFEKE